MGEAGASPGMGMVTPLATTVWSAGMAMRYTEFGRVLRSARVASGSPGSLQATTGMQHPDALASWELSFDPAIHRTFAAVFAMNMLQEPMPDGVRSWVEWVSHAYQAIQRVAAKCWAGVPSDVRRVLLDVDDAQPVQSTVFTTDLRQDEPGRRSLRFAGLDSMTVAAALTNLYRAIQGTEYAAEARERSAELAEDARHMAQMRAIRAKVRADARTIQAGETGGEAQARALASLRDAYLGTPELGPAVAALRTLNRLVHRTIWALVGLAEQVEPLRIREVVGAVVDDVADDARSLEMTIVNPMAALLRPTHPVWVELSTPIDGLYLVARHTVAWAGAEEIDLGLISLEPATP